MARGQTRIDLLAIVAAEINIIEPPALAQPDGKPVPLAQETQGGADSKSVVAHGGEYKYFVDRQGLRQPLVHSDIGKKTARKREMAGFGDLEPVTDGAANEILDDRLDRRGDGLAIVAATDVVDRLFYSGKCLEIGIDQSVLVAKTVVAREVRREGRLAARGQAGQFAFMAVDAESAGLGGIAVGEGEAVLRCMFHQQLAIVAVIAVELAACERANAVADVVAEAVGRVDKCIVPVGIEERRECVRLVMIDKVQRNTGAKAVIVQELLASEEGLRVARPAAPAQSRQLPLAEVRTQPAPHPVVDFLEKTVAQIARGKKRPRCRYGVNVAACPAGDLQNLIDGEPRQATRTLFSGKPLLLNRGNALVVVEGRRGGIVIARMKSKDAHVTGHTRSAANTR